MLVPPTFPLDCQPEVIRVQKIYLVSYAYGVITLFDMAFQPTSASDKGSILTQTSHLLSVTKEDSIWPVPCSLAVTRGIDISFSSCGYLDVSILRVLPHY